MKVGKVVVRPIVFRGQIFEGDGEVGHCCNMPVAPLGKRRGAEEAVFGGTTGIPVGVVGEVVEAEGGVDAEDGDAVGEEVGGG